MTNETKPDGTTPFSQAEIDQIHSKLAKDAGMTLEAYRAMLDEHAKQDWWRDATA